MASADALAKALMSAPGQPTGPSASALTEALAGVGRQYPRLAPYLANTVMQSGPAQSDGRMLEFYPPWESENPNPGKTTLELYDRSLKGPALQSAAAADMLHLLGGIDPRTGQPVDPTYYGMKQDLIKTLTPQQQKIDREAYQQEAPMYGGNLPNFPDWMQTNRSDAYIRGYMEPSINPEWQGVYNTQQLNQLEAMRAYLMNKEGGQ